MRKPSSRWSRGGARCWCVVWCRRRRRVDLCWCMNTMNTTTRAADSQAQTHARVFFTKCTAQTHQQHTRPKRRASATTSQPRQAKPAIKATRGVYFSLCVCVGAACVHPFPYMVKCSSLLPATTTLYSTLLYTQNTRVKYTIQAAARRCARCADDGSFVRASGLALCSGRSIQILYALVYIVYVCWMMMAYMCTYETVIMLCNALCYYTFIMGNSLTPISDEARRRWWRRRRPGHASARALQSMHNICQTAQHTKV